MHLFDVIIFYISLYNFGQTLRWFDSPRFLEWLIIWNGGNSNQSEFGMKKKKVVGWRLSSYQSPCWRPLRPCPVSVRHRGRPTAHGGPSRSTKSLHAPRRRGRAAFPRKFFRRQPSRFHGAVQSPARTFHGHHVYSNIRFLIIFIRLWTNKI